MKCIFSRLATSFTKICHDISFLRCVSWICWRNFRRQHTSFETFRELPCLLSILKPTNSAYLGCLTGVQKVHKQTGHQDYKFWSTWDFSSSGKKEKRTALLESAADILSFTIMETPSPTVPIVHSSYDRVVDERAAVEKEIDEWLPITSSRNGKWWYATVHNVTGIVGAGVLSFPYAMSELGWGPGITVIVLSWIITLYTLWQMVEMHEIGGKRFDRYHELGQHAFGDNLGIWLVVPQQLVVMVGVDIVYMVTGGKSLQKFHDMVCKHPKCKKIALKYFIMIFSSAHFVLSHLPNFNSISGLSLAAAIMSIGYCTIAWATSIHKGMQPNVEYGYKAMTPANTVFNFFSALGNVSFAYAGHNVAMEIQATMPSSPGKPSKVPMWRGVLVAYIIIALCYFPVAIIGYWMFGNDVTEHILTYLDKPTWLIAMANLFIVIHLIGGYQIYAIPIFDMIEALLLKKLNFMPSLMLRFVLRNAFVAFTLLFAISLPFFDGLLGFFGGFAFVPTTYFLPCIIWLVIYKPKKFTLSWFSNWICIVLGLLLMIVASIGSMKKIVEEAKCYKFYSDDTPCSTRQ